MRQSFMLLFSLIFFILGFQSSVTALENHLTFRVNGHEHKIDDIITAEIHRQYLINKPIYEDDFRNKAVDGSLTIIEASLNDKPGRIIYSSDPLDPTKLNIDIIIKVLLVNLWVNS